jgi:hypothetical protein
VAKVRKYVQSVVRNRPHATAWRFCYKFVKPTLKDGGRQCVRQVAFITSEHASHPTSPIHRATLSSVIRNSFQEIDVPVLHIPGSIQTGPQRGQAENESKPLPCQSAPSCACERALSVRFDFFDTDNPYSETISACLVPNLSEEGVDPERRVNENVGGAQLGSRFRGWPGNRMKTSAQHVPQKNLRDSASRLAASD